MCVLLVGFHFCRLLSFFSVFPFVFGMAIYLSFVFFVACGRVWFGNMEGGGEEFGRYAL